MLEKLNCYVKRLSIFLVTSALIVGMLGCGGESYALAIASTEGGSVTTPGEGMFTYDEGTVVNLVAEAQEGYRFIKWTGDVDGIDNVQAAVTYTAIASDRSITASFALEIWDWYDLDGIRDNSCGICLLMNDLDSTTPGYEELASETANRGKGWQPIGTVDAPFTAAFDGQGYEISALFINRPDEDYVGLFGYVNDGGILENLDVVRTDVTGYGSVGGLVGFNSGFVNKCYSTGSVTGNARVGNLVGKNKGTVSDSYSTGSVTGNARGGAMVGVNTDNVSNSYSSGRVTGNDYVGGLVGWNTDTVSNSYSSGSVTGNNYAGGLVGYNLYAGNVSNSHPPCSVCSVCSVIRDVKVSGLAAQNYRAHVSNSFWDIETSGQTTSAGGAGKTTAEMQDIATFTDMETEGLDEPWDIITVANPSARNPSYIWNIIDDETYPFLSWEPV